MAGTKLTDLSANSTPARTDVAYMVDDPGGSPADNKVELGKIADLASGRIVGFASARSSSSYAFTVNTNWQDVNTALDLTIADLLADDIVIVWINGSFSSGGQTAYLDVISRPSSTPANSWGNNGAVSANGSGLGNRGWLGLGGAVDTASGPIAKTLVAGDLDGGTLSLRLIGRLDTASSAKTFTTHEMGAIAVRL